MIEVIQGDCLEVLAGMDAGSVQMCVTSPPYWGLRDYGVDGQLGLEQTPDAYVAGMVDVFREVRRVLRDDGTLWLNLGDSYASDTKGSGGPSEKQDSNAGSRYGAHKFNHGLKPKDLVGVPWRLAFALQADGWWLRSDIVWAKPNPMPESVTDRPTKAHEYVFLLSKSARYFYDADAIREPVAGYERSGGDAPYLADGMTTHGIGSDSLHQMSSAGRNKRDVWTIATQPFPEAHFATFPEALVEPCVKAGSSHRACGVCGAPWRRVVERTGRLVGEDRGGDYQGRDLPDGVCGQKTLANGERYRPGSHYETRELGWQPTCDHDDPGEAQCLVLDPFAGSGTVGLVCKRLGRDFIGIELNPDYCEMARKRLAQPVTQELFA